MIMEIPSDNRMTSHLHHELHQEDTPVQCAFSVFIPLVHIVVEYVVYSIVICSSTSGGNFKYVNLI